MKLSKDTTNAHQQARDIYRPRFLELARRLSDGNLLPLAEYFGFVALPPSAGEAAAWTVDDWLAYGRHNGMTDVERTRHGTRIRHPVLGIGVHPAGSPGDVRSARNCAADFRRLFTITLTNLHFVFLDTGRLMYEDSLLIDNSVLCIQDFVGRLPQLMQLVDPGVTYEELGFATPKSEKCKIDVESAYSAMASLSRSQDPPVTFAATLKTVADTLGLPVNTEETSAILTGAAKLITDSRKAGVEELEVPMILARVLFATVEAARNSRELSELAKQQKREARQADKTQRRANRAQQEETRTPEQQFSTEVEAVRQKFADFLGRFGREIAQLSARHAKAMELIQAMELPVPTGLLAALADAQTRITALEAENAAVCAQAKALEGAGVVGAAVYKQRLEAFATEVHTRLSTRDFIGLAQAIQVLLPLSEQLALTGGDEPETTGEQKT